MFRTWKVGASTAILPGMIIFAAVTGNAGVSLVDVLGFAVIPFLVGKLIGEVRK